MPATIPHVISSSISELDRSTTEIHASIAHDYRTNPYYTIIIAAIIATALILIATSLSILWACTPNRNNDEAAPEEIALGNGNHPHILIAEVEAVGEL